MNNINQVVTTFLVAGGLGYVNYWILEKLDLTSSSNGKGSTSVTFSSLFFSIFDFFIYILLKFLLKWGVTVLLDVHWVKSTLVYLRIGINDDFINFAALVTTICFIFLITIKWGEKIVNKVYGLISGDPETGVEPGDPWTKIDKTGTNLVYLYSLDGDPISFGYGDQYSDELDNNYSINLQPISEINKQPELEFLTKCASEANGTPMKEVECTKSCIHVNLKQKFIMVIFKVKE